jgi:hypothetical protein
MRVYSGGVVQLHSFTSTRLRWVFRMTFLPLYPKPKGYQYHFNRRLGGPQSLSGRSGKQKNFIPLLGFENLSSSICVGLFSEVLEE